jgi:PilZ domain
MTHRAHSRSTTAHETTDPDRRKTHRFVTADEHGIRAVRIRPGHHATVIDASACGALIETSHRLLPGTRVELHLESSAARICVRARVVRCAVTQVRPAVMFYRGGVAFERHLPWFDQQHGYAVPSAEHRHGGAERADGSHRVA